MVEVFGTKSAQTILVKILLRDGGFCADTARFCTDIVRVYIDTVRFFTNDVIV